VYFVRGFGFGFHDIGICQWLLSFDRQEFNGVAKFQVSFGSALCEFDEDAGMIG